MQPAIILALAASSILQVQSPALVPPDSLVVPVPVAGPVISYSLQPVRFSIPDIDSAQGQRPRAFTYSHAYETRLAIHHWASYATIPLFVTEYLLGQKLFGDTSRVATSGTRSAHQAVALGLAGLFGVNTITGGWNLWEARKDPNTRLRRYLHSALMIVSDAGFVASGASAPGGRHSTPNLASREALHRGIAVASMGTALAGYVMMLVWK